VTIKTVCARLRAESRHQARFQPSSRLCRRRREDVHQCNPANEDDETSFSSSPGKRPAGRSRCATCASKPDRTRARSESRSTGAHHHSRWTLFSSRASRPSHETQHAQTSKPWERDLAAQAIRQRPAQPDARRSQRCTNVIVGKVSHCV